MIFICFLDILERKNARLTPNIDKKAYICSQIEYIMKQRFNTRKFTVLILLAIGLACNGQTFRKGALYTLGGVSTEYEGQLVQVSELSGSWRIIDPFTHRALRMSD